MTLEHLLRIGTHNGAFHCDEALACFMLKQLPEYRNAEIIRTRQQELLDNCDIVVDVGGKFDAEKKLFDHHQRSFTETMNSLNSKYKWRTKLSSAGLVYYHFGHRVISEILHKNTDSAEVNQLFVKIYEHLIEEVDAIDNGVEHCSDPKYRITTHLSARVGGLNPSWNEVGQNEDKLFSKAMSLVGEEFSDRLNWYAKSWIPARDVVLDAVRKRREVDECGEIICLSAGGCPWKEHIFDIEEELGLPKSIKFVIYPDKDDRWRVQAVSIKLGSFESRAPLLEAWRGIRDAELNKLTGLNDCIFVHASGFIGGARSRDSVIAMAKKTLEQGEKIS